ncbi:hypothetical protein N7451_010428 [Penicillium sp. IBT 35674x]|nr:hypothetical protein N7451_010428 [Penicillium sp. IBT 35674x]
MGAHSPKRRHHFTEKLPVKRVKMTPGPKKKKRSRSSSMGPPSLPKTSQSHNPSEGEGSGERTPASAQDRYTTEIPSDLRLPSPALVRPLSQVPMSPSFILTPVISSQSTFSTVVRSQETVTGLSGAVWLPPATRPQGPTRVPEPEAIAGGGQYPNCGAPAELDGFQKYKKVKETPPQREKGMITTVIDGKRVMQFRATDSLGKRKTWPVISLGKEGPFPRWRLFQRVPDLPIGRDLALDLIRTHRDKTIIHAIEQNGHPKSNDPSIGLGALYWDFQAGTKDTWGGLTKKELYEFAYKCLDDALSDYQSRTEIRLLLKQIDLSVVANVEDPLPPLPKPPKVTHFGAEAGAAWPNMPPLVEGAPQPYFGNRYWRPRMAVRDGQSKAKSTNWSITRMRHHMKGTLGRPGVTSRSRDPRDKTPDPPAAPNSGRKDYKKLPTGRNSALKAGGYEKTAGWRNCSGW